MAKHDKKGRSKKKPHSFIMLERAVLNSRAWHELSVYARAAYIEVASLYRGNNNGNLAMSVRTLAERLRCGQRKAHESLVELEDAGFIEVRRIGKFTQRAENRRASEYRLTVYKCDVTGEYASFKFNPNDRYDRIPTGHKTASPRDTLLPPRRSSKTVSPRDTHIESSHRQGGADDVPPWEHGEGPKPAHKAAGPDHAVEGQAREEAELPAWTVAAQLEASFRTVGHTPNQVWTPAAQLEASFRRPHGSVAEDRGKSVGITSYIFAAF